MTAANVHDVTQLGPLLEAIVVARPDPEQRRSKHLCADAGYQGRPAREIIESHRYIPRFIRDFRGLIYAVAHGIQGVRDGQQGALHGVARSAVAVDG